MSSFLPVSRAGFDLSNPEGYTAFSLFPHLLIVPQRLMLSAKKGNLKMQLKSRQFPKPGYCYVRSRSGDDIYQLYFDAGSERKLQVKNLLKNHCDVHATWNFVIPPE